MDTPERRRFGDEEIARILTRAIEMQERAGALPGATSGSAGGLTLADLRQVASEAGIDPRFVDLAVAQAPMDVQTGENAFLGGPVAWSLGSRVEGEIAPEDRDRVVQAIRSVIGQKGEIEDVYGRMEWSFDDGLGPTIVGVTSRDGETRIDVTSRRVSEAGLLHGIGIPAGAAFGGLALASALGLQDLAAFVVVVGSGAVTYPMLRFAWKQRARQWQRKLDRLLAAVTRAGAEVAAAPPAREDGETPRGERE